MAQPNPPHSHRRTTTTGSNAPPNNDVANAIGGGGGGSFLTKYFLVILFGFACLSLALNSRFTKVVVEDVSIIETVLKDSVQQLSFLNRQHPVLDDDHTRKEKNGNDSDDVSLKKQKQRPQVQDTSKDQRSNNDINTHKIANLNCNAYRGPSQEAAQEMVYWEDIPQDAEYVSPFHRKNRAKSMPVTQFLTFEPDHGGWNNIRMAMETVLAMAVAMGRTLVLPPHQSMYLLTKQEKGQRSHFSFDHFFHMESISQEHAGLDIISMTEFLELCMKGLVVDDKTGEPLYPPGNRTNWDGTSGSERSMLNDWIRSKSQMLTWDCEECVAAFPATTSEEDRKALEALPEQIKASGGFPPWQDYVGKPNPVDASPFERLKEMNAEREEVCIYTPELQQASWVHFPVGNVEQEGGEVEESRLLVHFYAFLFFQDWRHDLWMKRFVRDHVRYIDELQCAAARVVVALRNRVLKRSGGKSNEFDTIHIRRGDFQYTVTRFEAPKIVEMLSKKIVDNSTLYIATDERNKTFFDPIKARYDVVFLDDVVSELEGVNTNYYGMIDQLVASRGRIFYGCWFSTFTGYINRLRGYHADDHKLPGYKDGIIPSYYYALEDRFDHMQKFYPVKKSFYAREFPTSWRLIDTSIERQK
ncbi:GDP-fucose protein O-fucosyltransferase [Nitzschia inconspicua]|uniref:GDP-fucose protein O-fucosyltransferase n=1 Tax=Nitzschia inconspicua TaxID=303405 RepID=A0A9K3LS26_9STRA|nr:GDP-fucose protein O-fucosyltransferase [Nitzschia inconspicua]